LRRLKDVLLITALLLALLAWPATFILAVMYTWQGGLPIPVKLLVSATLGVLLAMIWPITWAFWGVLDWLGYQTPLDVLFQ
jgi:hypothetical protein